MIRRARIRCLAVGRGARCRARSERKSCPHAVVARGSSARVRRSDEDEKASVVADR
jgi:hypothetical protein